MDFFTTRKSKMIFKCKTKATKTMGFIDFHWVQLQKSEITAATFCVKFPVHSAAANSLS